MIKYILSSLLVMSFTATGQISIHGKIVNEQTKEPIPFVSIGVVGAFSGTVSNMHGEFKYSWNEKFEDSTLRISMYGFEPVEVRLADFQEKLIVTGNMILLKEMVYEQQEVVVRGFETKEKVLGRVEEKGNLLIQFISDQLGAQIGTIIKTKKRTIVEDFNFYLRQTNYDSVIFRLNFYDYDVKTDSGDSLLTESSVFSVVGDHDGMYKLDLRDKYIQIKKDFIVAVEIVGGSKGDTLEKNPMVWFGGGFGGGCKAKIASQSAWINVPTSAVGFYLNVRQAKKKNRRNN